MVDFVAHPEAELFPLLTGADFDTLTEDIRFNGLIEPITRTPEGRILDGRNRARACALAGVEPSYQVHEGDPWTFAVSRNLHRRHLTGPQRAMIGARIAERTRWLSSRSRSRPRPRRPPCSTPPTPGSLGRGMVMPA